MQRDRGVMIALGGNSIVQVGEQGTLAEQWAHTDEAMCEIAALWLDERFPLVISHGNGPQIGRILLRSEIAAKELDPLPLDVAVADSQAGMGYMIQQLLSNRLGEQAQGTTVITLITRVEVDEKDPAFQNPNKPVGIFHTEAEAKRLMASRGWEMKEDAGRGWRRVVASPRPKRVIESRAVRELISCGEIVIAGGGGGVPVVRHEDGGYVGVPCVVDKDLASALLAEVLGFQTLVIVTAVPRVCVDWGKPTQRELDKVTVSEAERFFAEGQFPAGSMGPKIEAAIAHARSGGVTIITCPGELASAMAGEAGTWVVAD